MGKKKGKKKSVSEVLAEPIDVQPDNNPSITFTFGQEEAANSNSTPCSAISCCTDKCICENKTDEVEEKAEIEITL